MQHIEVRTTQNVAIEYELASLRERIMAYFLDGLLFAMAYYILYFFILIVGPAFLSEADSGFFWFMGLFPLLGWILYHLLFEVLNRGQSPGKKVLGIRVIRIDGRQPEVTDHLLRAVFQIADSMVSMGVVASVLIVSSEKRQRFGDMAANTTVVRVRPDRRFELSEILSINSLENYTPEFPEVRHLSEKDILVIKSTLDRYRRFPNRAHAEALIILEKKLVEILNIKSRPKDKQVFLKKLIRDYIVLTR